MSFVDEIAAVGTNVKEINMILESEELTRPQENVALGNREIALKNVTFTYGKTQEAVLKGVDLTIKPGTVTMKRRQALTLKMRR